MELSNQYIKLTLKGAGIVEMQVDPAGKSPRSISFVKDLRPEFWQETSETRVDIKGSRAVISPLEIWEYRPVVPEGHTDTPAELKPGHTLGQTFTVPAGNRFNSISIKLPTWNSTSSGATLSLYQGEKLLASHRLESIPDNSWQILEIDTPQGEGTYTVTLSDPVGTIGWWSTSADSSSIGEALEDRKPVPCDRAIQVNEHKLVGMGKLILALQENKLTIEAEMTTNGELSYKSFPWRWRTTWTKDGYDCTPKSGAVFSRFFTDNQRYMPIQQLKRRDHGGLAFDGFRWLEMDGTSDADLRLEGANHLHWEMRPDEMHLRFDTPFEKKGDVLKTHWTLIAKPREDSIPEEFPRFSCSDKAVEADLNRFWWERAFSYGSPAVGSAEWFEWMAIMRAWYDGPQRDGEIRHLMDYPITPEGYVYTCRDLPGWPLVPNRDTRHFDTNARFILGCWRHYLWTGDTEFLKKQADRLRSAMTYQLEVLKGKDGLIVTPDFKTGRHEDLSNNYWDILPFGHLDAYANAAFYGSLEVMAQIEETLERAERSTLNIQRSTSNAGSPTPVTRHLTPAYLRSLAERSHRSYDHTFWDDAKGRYIGCVDSDGVKHDYGFTFVNLEALYYGLGDAEKARRIYKWMETEPTSSGEADTYSKWIFAPRATTIHNPPWQNYGGQIPPSTINHQPSTIPPWWTYWWHGTPFGDQCQDGGAILYTSFFDLMDRVRYRDADNAWERFMQILERYRMPDRLCGGSPLYRGEVSQQENAGAVGVDYPFPESGMVPLYFLYGIMGVEATPDGLRITPRLPKALSYAEVDSLEWHGMKLRVRVTRRSVEVTGKSLKKKFAFKPGEGVLLKASDLSPR